MSWSHNEILTYSANTNLTGEIVLPTGVNTQTINIPNATEFKVWSNIWIGLNSAVVSAADSFETVVGELAWTSALPTYEYDTNTNKISAINGSALAGGGEVSHDNTLSGNGTVDSPLGVTSGYIQMLSVKQPFTANAQNYVATASVPDGYEFLCWVNMCTNGFSQVFYPLAPTSSICTWWLGGSNSTPGAGDSVDSRYLVVRKAQ